MEHSKTSRTMSPFVLNSGAIASVVFMSLSIASFVGTFLAARKQINVLYLAISLILIVAFIITMLTSKPRWNGNEAEDDATFGWLFNMPNDPIINPDGTITFDYKTGAYVMIAFSVITGLAYAGSAVLQTKRLFFSKAK